MEQHQLDIYNRATTLLEKLDSSFLDLGRLLRKAQEEDKKLALAGKTPNKKMKVVLLYLRPKQYAAYRTAMLKFGAQEAGRGLAGHEAALMKLIGKAAKKK